MEDTEAMSNLIRVNPTLSQKLTQAQETIFVLSKKLQALQVHTKTKKPALNTLVEQQSSPTKNMEATITHFWDYAATNTSAILQYKASDMILHIDSDASYL